MSYLSFFVPVELLGLEFIGLIGVLPATPKDADLAKWLGVKYPSRLGTGWPCASLKDIGLLDLLSSVISTVKVWAISLRISRKKWTVSSESGSEV